MTRWMMHPPEREPPGKRDQFDPITEGARYGLSRDRSLAIWERVYTDATDGAGRRDTEQARRRFYEIASRMAARGGRLRPDVGRVTRVGVELDGGTARVSGTDELAIRVPGRETLVATEARRWAQISGEPAVGLEDDRGADGAERDALAIGRGEIPGADEVDPARAAMKEKAVAVLAPQLGLDPAAVDVRSDDDAGRRVASAGASGLMEAGVVYLGPDSYDATTQRGRYLLAHELVHVAQSRLAPDVDRPSGRDAAEAEAAHIGQAWAHGESVAAPTVSLSVAAADTGAEQMAKARPAAQSDFVLHVGNDNFVVSFELLPKAGVGGDVRVVISPTDFSRAYQSQMKYWDVRGREVDKDDSWISMGNQSIVAAPWVQQVPIADRTKFAPVILKELPDKAATVWTFDWNGDSKPELAIRIDFSISNTIRDYHFTTSDNKNVKRFDFHFIQDDAWKHGYQGNVGPRRKNDDFVDFLGDILSSKTTWEMAITMIPVIGELVLLGEAITGYTIFGDRMSTTERVVSGLAALLPVAAGVVAKGVTKGGADLAKVAAKIGRSEEEVMALLRASEKQGTEAATVEKWSSTLKAGGKLTVDEVAKLQRVVRQLEADQRVFRAAEQEMGASRVLRKGGKVEQTGPVSLKRLRTTLGQSGVSPSGYHLRKATKADLDALRAAGTDPSSVYAWVSRDGNNVLAVDARGRPVMTFTEKGLSSLEEAVKSFGHEAKHIKDFAAGMATSSEALAEKAGEELWALVLNKMRK